MTELLPCPFCGGEGIEKWADGGRAINWIECSDCGAKGPWAKIGHDGSGARNWNTRAAPKELAHRIGQLKNDYEGAEAIAALDEAQEIVTQATKNPGSDEPGS